VNRAKLAEHLAVGTPWTPETILEALEHAEHAGLSIAEAAALIAEADTSRPILGDAVWAAMHGREAARKGALYRAELRRRLRFECPHGLPA
jgi:hypothetical protein